jgi:hypothetical protein
MMNDVSNDQYTEMSALAFKLADRGMICKVLALRLHDRNFNKAQPWQHAAPQLWPGDCLEDSGRFMPKGAYLVAAKPYSEHKGDRHLHVILAVWSGASGQGAVEYVTWIHDIGSKKGTQMANCFWGHYFKDESEALIDFADRGVKK